MKKNESFSAPTFEQFNQFIIVCFAHDELMVDWSERRRENILKTPQAPSCGCTTWLVVEEAKAQCHQA
ncbi:hypothetical protein, partial [Paenisporosarcina sp. TG-14]|uniref:hypothetical protein n=1 Tax=Paenisporosarcina sp. TG-14 TaxID=1231057 RepID=UPI001ED9AFD7